MNDAILQNETPVVLAVGFILVLLCLLIIYFWTRKLKRGGKTVLLTGICDSGKTSIFTRLTEANPNPDETYTSAKPNEAYIPLKGTTKNAGSKFHLVDIPGHDRVREKYIDDFKTSLLAIVFVVDSATLSKRLRDVAEFLYSLMRDNDLQRIPMLIVCHKQDLSLAKGQSVVQRELEKEIKLLQDSHLTALNAEESRQSTVNPSCNDLEYIETSTIQDKTGEYSVNQIHQFVNSVLE